jgi:hypothetical protein
MLMVGVSLTGCANALVTEGSTSNNPLRQTPGATSSVGPKGDQSAPDTSVVVEPAATTGGEAPPAGEVPAPTEALPAEGAPPAEVAPAEPAAEPTVNPALANVQLPSAADLEQRWREMQVDRAPFDAPRSFVSSGSEIVWWFDPLFGQLVPIGEIRGEFVAQASFRIKGQWIGALEIPYNVNQAYGIVVPEPVVQRMRNAGKGEWAEVFIYQTGDVTQK